MKVSYVPFKLIRKAVLVFVTGVILTTVGCAESAFSQDNPPVWIENPSRAYSDSRYLMATGSGSSLQRAEEAALANLARIFEATIESDRQTVQDYEEISRDGQITATEETARMLNLTNVRSEQDLLNTEILTRSESGGRYYALAGMERTPTLSIYTNRIEANFEEIQAYAEAGDRRENPIARLAAYRQALILKKINVDLIEQRSIIAGGGGAFSASNDFAPSVQDLEERFAKAQQNAPLYVDGSAPRGIITETENAVASLGFVTTQDESEAVLSVQVDYRHEPVLENRDDALFLYWTLDVALSHLQRGQTYGIFSTDGRSGATSQTDVRLRAHRDAESAINEDFPAFIAESLLKPSRE